MGELPAPNNDQPAIARQISRVYLATVLNATNLNKYLIQQEGPLEPLYIDFYECFITLFRLTSPYKDIAEDQTADLLKAIRRWFSPEHTRPTKKNAIDGIRLFEEWQVVLARKDVISWHP